MAARRPLAKVKEEEDEAAELLEYYCEPYVESDAPTLSGTSGATLRHRRKRPARIETNTPGYNVLKKKITDLKRAGDRAEILRLLRMLRDWEMLLAPRGLTLPAALRDNGSPEGVEHVHLTDCKMVRSSTVNVR